MGAESLTLADFTSRCELSKAWWELKSIWSPFVWLSAFLCYQALWLHAGLLLSHARGMRPNMVFTWKIRNPVIHLPVHLILTVSRFLIICVQLCLDSSTSQPLFSIPIKNIQKPGSGVYMPQWPGFYWSTHDTISRFLNKNKNLIEAAVIASQNLKCNLQQKYSR